MKLVTLHIVLLFQCFVVVSQSDLQIQMLNKNIEWLSNPDTSFYVKSAQKWYKSDSSYRYFGPINNKAKFEGYGEVYYNNGVYKGELKNGFRNGIGSYLWNNGTIYEGGWKNGNKSGYGEVYYSNGNSYCGEWIKDEKSGQGEFCWNTGGWLVGTWYKNHVNGYAESYYPNGDIYKGDFSYSKKSGNGEYYWNNGNYYKGQFYNKTPWIYGELVVSNIDSLIKHDTLFINTDSSLVLVKFKDYEDKLAVIKREVNKYKWNYIYTDLEFDHFEAKQIDGKGSEELFIYTHDENWDSDWPHGGTMWEDTDLLIYNIDDMQEMIELDIHYSDATTDRELSDAYFNQNENEEEHPSNFAIKTLNVLVKTTSKLEFKGDTLIVKKKYLSEYSIDTKEKQGEVDREESMEETYYLLENGKYNSIKLDNQFGVNFPLNSNNLENIKKCKVLYNDSITNSFLVALNQTEYGLVKVYDEFLEWNTIEVEDEFLYAEMKSLDDGATNKLIVHTIKYESDSIMPGWKSESSQTSFYVINLDSVYVMTNHAYLFQGIENTNGKIDTSYIKSELRFKRNKIVIDNIQQKNANKWWHNRKQVVFNLENGIFIMEE